MLEILKFVFSGFWVFLGSYLLLRVVCSAIVATLGLLIAAFKDY